MGDGQKLGVKCYELFRFAGEIRAQVALAPHFGHSAKRRFF